MDRRPLDTAPQAQGIHWGGGGRCAEPTISLHRSAGPRDSLGGRGGGRCAEPTISLHRDAALNLPYPFIARSARSAASLRSAEGPYLFIVRDVNIEVAYPRTRSSLRSSRVRGKHDIVWSPPVTDIVSNSQRIPELCSFSPIPSKINEKMRMSVFVTYHQTWWSPLSMLKLHFWQRFFSFFMKY